VDALLRELESHAWLTGRRVLGVDIGGGTPTRLPTAQLKRLVGGIMPLLHAAAHPFPVSIETTPRIAADEPEKLADICARGVGRVSLGVQSFNVETLALVNRRREAKQTEIAAANLRAAGFARINVDIIFGLPSQTLSNWRYDLERVIALEPDSISTYDCLYRGHGRALTIRATALPPPDTYGDMYDLAHKTLSVAGWHAPYGSVNFSRHRAETGTSAYFEGRLLDGLPYLGLGNYATSMRGNLWSFNTHDLRDYMARVLASANPSEYFYELPSAESQAKYSLYSLNYGFIDGARFKRRFGVPFADVFAQELNYMINMGWLERNGDLWEVAPGQFRRMPCIRSLFYSKAAQNWLMALE
jgi:oxygen-independent coproporphyrinogen-3 oxidase